MMILKSDVCKTILLISFIFLVGCAPSGSETASSEPEVQQSSFDVVDANEQITLNETEDTLPPTDKTLSELLGVATIENDDSISAESDVEPSNSDDSILETSNTADTEDTSENPVSVESRTMDLSITWIDNSNNEVEFLIERRTSSNVDYGTTYTVAENITSFSDTAVEMGETYCYRVSASNSMGSSPSQEVCIDV